MQPVVMQALGNFNLDYFTKALGNEVGNSLNFDISEKFPENMLSYTKYLSKSLEKNNGVWKKVQENFRGFEEALSRAATFTNNISQNMLELYNVNEKLGMVVHRKDESSKKIFLDAHKFFHEFGRIKRKEVDG